MHNLSKFTGSARHGWDRMAPSMGFGTSRSHQEMGPSTIKRSFNAQASSPAIAPNTHINHSFIVPFSSSLAGPDEADVIYGSPGAFNRWIRPSQDEGIPTDRLPVHAQNLENLRALCRHISESSSGAMFAKVTSSRPKPIPGLQRAPNLVTNVILSGEAHRVREFRAKVLTESPILLKCANVDIDYNLIFDAESNGVKQNVLSRLDEIASWTKADIFLLQPKQPDIESASFNGHLDTSFEQRLRCAIYGDIETAEHAKIRVLILIDQLLGRKVDMTSIELTLHTLISGRGRKNIKQIESSTNTAIYFPPSFLDLYGYTPPGAKRRNFDEIYITGETAEAISAAKAKLHDLLHRVKTFTKKIMVTQTKLDSVLLERLDKVRKIIENNGSYVLFPPLGYQNGEVRVQGTDVLNVERTVRELMALAGQFYGAQWAITEPEPTSRRPQPSDIHQMLSDISINSGAEISFDDRNFHINGSDDAVKAAMHVLNEIGYVRRSKYQMSVKIELANEHKEFVSGKKNGKVNKIMSNCNVQIVFEAFNEYNFYIVVRGTAYSATKNGLELVEQEMPAAISFHVPDQYHKRIIGIGGQHIQRIMKKYSVFVKFSNAMDRGGLNRDDDDLKVDNVICRTPARNAQNLDLVKQEIMDMVEKVDAEFVTEKVIINRLYHRALITRMRELEELEKKWNCKITFPSTEQASDEVTISGPEYQVPQAVDEFLTMVPEKHELAFPAPEELKKFLRSPEFQAEVIEKMKSQYVVDIHVRERPPMENGGSADGALESLELSYTRNNAGGLRDAIDFLTTRLVAHGLDISKILRGTIPRPKSDSFEDSLPFFDSKLLQRAEPPVESTDSPTRSQFGDDPVDRLGGLFNKLRRPGSMSSFSSWYERRKNGNNSPGSLFKQASSNASKASLISIESTGSGYRNPWNDSGINLADDDHSFHATPATPGANGWGSMGHRYDSSKFSFGGSTTSLVPSINASASASATTLPGDMTPRYDQRASVDSGRPSTSHSLSGYPGPIGPPTAGGPR